jgi:putative peptide zinc metalloprotease protein
MSQLPRLRPDLVLVEQIYRGEPSFIVKDPELRKYYRFRPVEIRVMQALDGEHTAAQAATTLARDGMRISALAVETFARKLAAMGLCERTVQERSVLLMERLRAERRNRLSGGLLKGDILRLRCSVGDPDKLLDRWLPRLRFFFSPAFIGISVLLFAAYFLVIGVKWPEFSRAVTDLYTFQLSAGSLAVLWLTGTFIIVVHELGHGVACKYFGGQVHEMGAMLFYFEPAFYCNVNDAWTFPELRARLWVTAAGSWIQLVLAGIAALVWWATAPGTLIAEVALAAVLIGGVTTIFMNINPLIPLDGYYALSDYLEVPNLRQRAFRHLGWWLQTRVLRLDVPRPPADEREQRIFLIYGGLAAGYITMILGFFAAHAYGWLNHALGLAGVLIFAAGVWLLIRRRIGSWWQAGALALRRQRSRWQTDRMRLALGASGLAALLLGWLVPCPITISGPFTVAAGASVPHTAPDSGVVGRVNVSEGILVPAGARLLTIRNFGLERERAASRRVGDSLASLIAPARARQQVSELSRLDAIRAMEEARLAGLNERIRALEIRALNSGIIVTPRPEESLGQWVSAGQVLLVVGQPDSVEVRIALTGAGATSVRAGQTVRLLPEASRSTSRSNLGQVSAAAGSSRAIEARVRLAGDDFWRPGMTGRARIVLQRSNMWAAVWWKIRRTVRTDILL